MGCKQLPIEYYFSLGTSQINLKRSFINLDFPTLDFPQENITKGKINNYSAKLVYSPFGPHSGIYNETSSQQLLAVYFSETNLIYYNHRYYSSGLGRWLRRDPIAENRGYNLYRIVGNALIFRVDYLGKLCFAIKGDETFIKIFRHFEHNHIPSAYDCNDMSVDLQNKLITLNISICWTVSNIRNSHCVGAITKVCNICSCYFQPHSAVLLPPKTGNPRPSFILAPLNYRVKNLNNWNREDPYPARTSTGIDVVLCDS